jgi:hypothetical protein
MEGLAKFFTGIGGILSGLAAVIAGASALYFAVIKDGDEPQSNAGFESTVVTPGAGGNNAEPIEPTGPTLREWRTQANEICRRWLRDARQFGRPTTPEELAIWLSLAFPASKETTNDLRALERPPEQRREIERLLVNLDEQNDAAETAVQAWQTGDAAGWQSAVGDLTDLGDTGATMASELGANDCAEPVFR